MLAYVGAWAAIVSVLLAAGAFLRRGALRAETARSLGATLERAGPGPWTRAVNGAFLHLFDRFYGGRQTMFEDALWAGLIQVPIIVGALSAMNALPFDFGFRIEYEYVSGGLFFAPVIALVLAAIRYLLLRLQFHRWRKHSAAALMLALLLTPVLLGGAMLVYNSFATIESLKLEPYGLEFWDAWFIFYGPPLLLALFVLGRMPPLRVPVHPLKVLVSTAFFLALVGLIQRDAGERFIAGVECLGLRIVGFLAFNLVADSVSLVETRWILRRGAHATLRTLAGLLALDLALSAVIFLFIPSVLGVLPEFQNAILFRGNEPWLGILFWTTFSTSVLLYAFIIAALLARFVAHLVRAVHTSIDFGTEPVVGITVAMVGVVTIGFLVAGVVQRVGIPARLAADPGEEESGAEIETVDIKFPDEAAGKPDFAWASLAWTKDFEQLEVVIRVTPAGRDCWSCTRRPVFDGPDGFHALSPEIDTPRVGAVYRHSFLAVDGETYKVGFQQRGCYVLKRTSTANVTWYRSRR